MEKVRESEQTGIPISLMVSLILGVLAFFLLALATDATELTRRPAAARQQRTQLVPAWSPTIRERPLVVYVESSEDQDAFLEGKLVSSSTDFTILISPQDDLYRDILAELTAIGTNFSVVDLRNQ